MSNQSITFRSSISSLLIRKALLRGTFLGSIGVFLLLGAGIFLPPHLMKIWGFLVFIFGFGFIAWGLIPYKRLKRLEINPDTLTFEENQSIYFSSRGQRMFTIPLQAIENVNYKDSKTHYGMGIILKSSCSKKIIIHESQFDFISFRKKSLNLNGADLFFLYFTKRTYTELKSLIDSSSTHQVDLDCLPTN